MFSCLIMYRAEEKDIDHVRVRRLGIQPVNTTLRSDWRPHVTVSLLNLY